MMRSLQQLIDHPEQAFAAGHRLLEDPQPVTWRDFLESLRQFESQLDKRPDSARVAVFMEDSLAFLAALVAIWRRGKTPVIPPNNLPSTTAGLRQLTDFFIGDFETCPLPPLERSPDSLPLQPSGGLILFTSGSNGAPQAINKNFSQLQQELNTLEAVFGDQIGPARVLATVSHQHIYGLLFRLLWPLLSGRILARSSLAYWEEVALAARLGPCVLVASPAHLARIPDLAWSQPLQRVFCSGAPLTAEQAASAHGKLGSPITMVYGSTETGGIAWRTHPDAYWQPFPGVTLRSSAATSTKPATLVVGGAHLPAGETFTTQDRVRFVDKNRFVLCGRIDRLAKLGGKRISLSQMEQLLTRHEWVEHARVLIHPRNLERLAAVLALNSEGHAALQRQGKSAVNETLRGHLAGVIERIALPRYWRYCHHFPCNSQGKTTLADLQALFVNDGDHD